MTFARAIPALFVAACLAAPRARAESPAAAGEDHAVTSGVSRAANAMPLAPREALQQVRIPEVELRDASITDASTFLATVGQVNIIVHPRAAEQRAKVTVSMRNVTLEQALRAITSAADLTYNVERRYIMIVTRDDAGDMARRTYSIPQASMRGAEKAGAKEFLAKLGIPFPEAASATYNFATARLVVVNTPANLAKLDKIVAALNGNAVE